VRPIRLVAVVGATIGLCIMGDSLLYNILPLEADRLGIGLPAVGILLSVNRLVRLGSNTWASTLFERLGPHGPFAGAVVLGLVSTMLYGVGAGFAIFFVARMLWGIAWSGLRQGGYQAIWAGPQAVKGRLTGLLWGLVRLGSAISVLVGGVLYDRYGFLTTIALVLAGAVLAVPVAFSIRWPSTEQDVKVEGQLAEPVRQPAHDRLPSWSTWRLVLDTPMRRWLTATGFFLYLLSGVVVSTTSLFLASRIGETNEGVAFGLGIATVTGVLHGVRWLTDLALGPAIGVLSDRIGQANMAAAVVCILLLGLAGAVTLPVSGAILSLFLVLVADGALHIVLSAAASGVALLAERPHIFIGVYTTFSDAGSACGPLIAYSVASAIGLPTAYLTTGVVLTACIVRFWQLAHTAETTQRSIGA
jgi:MFS family permease